MIKVKLTYFKPSGKYYSEGEYETPFKTFHQIIDQVRASLFAGSNPGLVDYAVVRDRFYTLVEIQDDKLGVPALLTPPEIPVDLQSSSYRVAQLGRFDIEGPGGLPLNADGFFLPCALCGSISCDHTPAERPDSWDNVQKRNRGL